MNTRPEYENEEVDPDDKDDDVDASGQDQGLDKLLESRIENSLQSLEDDVNISLNFKEDPLVNPVKTTAEETHNKVFFKDRI